MRTKTILALVLTFRFIACLANVNADLPLDDRIKIIKVLPFRSKENRENFIIRMDEYSYEKMFKAVQKRIKDGYKGDDAEAEYDNEYLMNLDNRRWTDYYPNNPAIVTFVTSKKKFHSGTQIQCVINTSRNKKFVGLAFIIKHNFYEVSHQHFVLVNSKGEIVWEFDSPKKPIDFGYHEINEFDFPHDGGTKNYYNFDVSDKGYVFFDTQERYTGEDEIFKPGGFGWVIFDNRGKQVIKKERLSRHIQFSPDGSYLLVQEKVDPKSKQFDHDSPTSCYSSAGKLLWKKENIVPIKEGGYFISPSGKYILTCSKKGDLYDYCILNKEGEIIAEGGRPYKEKLTYEKYKIKWGYNEKLLFWNKRIHKVNLKLLNSFNKINKPLRKDYGRLFFQRMNKISEDLLVAVGFRGSGFGHRFEHGEEHKFIMLLDENYNPKGVKFFRTEGYRNTNFRLKIDNLSHRIYVRTDFVLIKADVLLKD